MTEPASKDWGLTLHRLLLRTQERMLAVNGGQSSCICTSADLCENHRLMKEVEDTLDEYRRERGQ